MEGKRIVTSGVKGSRVVCLVENCNKLSRARGYCCKHYKRIQSNGTLTTKIAEHGAWKAFVNSLDLSKSECVLWPFGANGFGYGQVRSGPERIAHRYVYAHFFGPIPKNMFVCHTCDVPRCVNPNHLKLGTPADNVRDRDSRGRRSAAKGESCNFAVLKEEQVRAILEKLSHGLTNEAIANQFGVTASAVSDIRTEKCWKHIDRKHKIPVRKGNAKLNKEQVLEIIKALESGGSLLDLSKQFKISQGCISDIKAGRTWKGIQ